MTHAYQLTEPECKVYVSTMADDALTQEQIKRLRRAIEERGIAAVAEEIGLARGTLASLVGGMPVQQGTVALARANISKVKA